MEFEAVKRMISEYKGTLGKIARLKAEKSETERKIKRLRALEADTLKAAVVDGLPKGTGKGDPTGRKGMALASGAPTDEEEARLRQKLTLIEGEMDTLQKNVDCVDGWLSALMDRERLIIDLQLVQRKSWRVVGEEYKKAFGDEFSDDTLRRMRDRTIEYIARMM